MSGESNGTPAKAKPLTRRQRLFIQEFLVDLNATKAYRRVYTKVKSDKVAGVNAAQLLGTPRVQAALAEAQAERAKRVELSADWVLERLRRESEMPGDGKNANSARVKALELIGKHLAMFVDRVAVEQGLRLEIVEEIITVRTQAVDAVERLEAAEHNNGSNRNGNRTS